MTQNLYLISLNKTMVEKEQINTPIQRILESEEEMRGRKYNGHRQKQ
ncbi:MAG: hypothetical protein IPI10_10570 [Bacteroidetes bacterium]|nr:hypothetical protein [Bacteroidota bacterium]